MERFGTFVVCRRSRRAFEAAMAVVSTPTHNPLVLYGRSGSGKTHLLRIIENRMRESRREARITRTAAAHLADQMIAAIRADAYPELRRALAQNEAFLLEDLDMLADRKQTLEEILRFVEECVRSGVQVVMTTSVRPGVLGLTPDIVARRFPQALVAKLHVTREVSVRRARARVLFQQALR